jgi:hypothetical protein
MLRQSIIQDLERRFIQVVEVQVSDFCADEPGKWADDHLVNSLIFSQLQYSDGLDSTNNNERDVRYCNS